MSVQLIGHSSCNGIPQDLVEDIAWVARISNPSNRVNTETSERLVRYLIKHKHWSPFEMFHATLQIETTRDIGRQILRHRSFSFQEFSQRYAEVEAAPEYREARMQDPKNRQSSVRADDGPIHMDWLNIQRTIQTDAQSAYKWALEKGIAKEQARAVLPEGITGTTMLMSGSIRSWIHYIELRTEAGTQAEHRLIAQKCAGALYPIFPMIEEFLYEAD